MHKGQRQLEVANGVCINPKARVDTQSTQFAQGLEGLYGSSLGMHRASVWDRLVVDIQVELGGADNTACQQKGWFMGVSARQAGQISLKSMPNS